MEIGYVREFLSLAETGSFFETAEQMFVTTSSLSRHIKILEEEIGGSLFSRSTRKVSLNENGKLFLPYARELVRIDDQCTRAFEMASKDAAATLTVGSIPGMRAYGITSMIAEFKHTNKSTVLNVTEGDSLHLLELLREGSCDLAFVRNSSENPDSLCHIPFATDHLVAILPDKHPLAQQDVLSLEQLREEPLLLIGKDAYMYELCTKLCRENGFEPHVVFTSHGAENLVDLVQQGLGISLLMKKPVEKLVPPDLRILDITPEVTSTIYLAYQEDMPKNRAFQRFVEMAQGADSCNEQ